MAEETLTAGWQSLARTVPAEVRRISWEALSAKTTDPDFVNAHAADLSRLILDSTQIQFNEIQRSITAVVRHSLTSNSFLKEFTAALVKLEHAKPVPSAAHALLRWSGLVLHRLDPTTAKKAVTKLIECQSSWFSVLIESGDRRLPTHLAVGHVLHTNNKNNDNSARFLDEYIAVITSKGSAPLVKSVWQECHRHGDASKLSSALLQTFIDKVLSSTNKEQIASTATLQCYEQFFSSLSLDDIQTLLLPAAVRMIRRSPEVALPPTLFMFNSLRQDLSGTVDDVLPSLIQLSRHAKETVRQLAIAATAAYSSKLYQASAVKDCIDAVKTVLSGNSDQGKIKNAQERAALASMLEAFAEPLVVSPTNNKREHSIPQSADAVCADTAFSVSEFVCSFYKEEVTEEGKLALLKVLSAWLPRCTQFPDSVAARIAEGFKEKEALRRSHIKALSKALSANAQLRTQASGFVPALASLVKEGVAKFAMRTDGIYALLSIACIAAGGDAAAVAAIEKEKVWDIAVFASGDEAPPLLSSATAAQFSPVDAAAHAELAGALLVLHAQQRLDLADRIATVSDTLVFLLLHYSPAVRTAAIAAVQGSSSGSNNNEEIMLALLRSLHHWITNASTITIMQDPANGDVQMSLEAVHERYYHALLSIAAPTTKTTSTRTTSIPVDVAVYVLVLSHHPMISHARRGGKGAAIWGSLCHKMKLSLQDIVSTPDNAEAIVAALVTGPLGIQQSMDDARQNSAACGALKTAASVAAPALFPSFMKAVLPLLERSEHDALTAKQLRIYATPRGRVSNENEDGSMIPAELFEDMLRDKSAIASPVFLPAKEHSLLQDSTTTTSSSATGAGKNTSSSRAAPTVRPSQAAAPKSGKPKPKDPAAEARERQLKSETEIRNTVISLREGLSQGLQAIGAFATGMPSFSIHHFDELSAPVLPLLTSPLVGNTSALECTSNLAACIAGPLGWNALDVAASLRLVSIAEGDDGSSNEYQKIAGQLYVKNSVLALLKSTGGKVVVDVDGYSDGDGSFAVVPGTQTLGLKEYMFCFPILKAVLSCPMPTPLHDAALAVLSLHIYTDKIDFPKSDAFKLLYHVLEILPAFRDRVQSLLCALCTSIQPHDTSSLLAALQGVLAGPAFARFAALNALSKAPALSGTSPPDDSSILSLLWIARNDPSEDNATAGKALWETAGCTLCKDSFVPGITTYLDSTHADVRAAAANGIADGVCLYPAASTTALTAAIDVYNNSGATQNGRLGAAATLSALAPYLSSSDLTQALDFLLKSGLVDSNNTVRAEMVSAGIAIVDASGKEHSNTMLPLFDSYLENTAASHGLTEEQYDHIKEAAVVFLGTLAKHLDPSNPKVKSIIQTLVEVLMTPSEAVQKSVSDRLPPLMQAMPQSDAEFSESIVKHLLDKALHGASYGDRRGAAYGLAGAVKGLGLSSLKGYGITEALKVGIESKNDVNAREGALLAFECLSDKLGRLFEPYVIHILPMLLTSFGDASPQVRDAANGAARIIMGQLSAQGVKLVLPVLLNGVEDKLWRTKQGSIQLLGAMAHCAPKQLSACLPTIVPRLGEVLADPHPKVAAAAKQALDEVGSVIRNPEVSRLVPVLLKSVADPSKQNKVALNTLLTTVFVNTIDAASLALIVPVVHRGLKDRSGDVKKRAGRIVGNLCALINDPKDMTPYISLLLPELQSALMDPLPEVRATAAKALGALTAGMGAANIGDITPWLLEKMRSEVSGVERSGAAQGLAETLAVQGAVALQAVLPQILDGCKARAAATREGSLTLFKYLPYCMPEVFRPHLPEILPAVLDGLADESEGVRDASLSSGRVAVELYSNTALPLLLPAVEAGAVNANWRIRQSSIELLGDLLFKVAGTTGRIQQDLHDDDGEGISVEAHGQAIVDALGMNKRNHILGLLYLARSDVAYTVRTAALHVWKTIITNTPKTLGEILPSLMDQVIQSLAEEDEERREAAGRCLGELVRKMGDRVLSQILPILKEGMLSPDPETRSGVCNGLREVMENATRHQLADHLTELLPAVQAALCDEDAAVRASAGGVINVLFKSGGGAGAIDSVIPSLLRGLEGDEEHASKALEGLRVVLSVRPQLLSSMVPSLVQPPVTSTNLKALGALAEVAGPSIHGLLSTVVPVIVLAASDHPDVSPAAAAAHAALSSVAISIQDDGLHIFMAELHKGLDDPTRRRGSAAAIVCFCKETRLDFQEHVSSLIGSLVPLLTEDDPDTLLSVWDALVKVMGSIPKELAPSYVRTLRDAVISARERQRRKHRPGPLYIPGFALPKALSPILPVYLQGVLQGSSAELRELAAEGLGDVIELTPEDALKPFVVQITGPLIRIIGDRFPSQTKAAILRTMGLLVDRAGVGLRPFIPQLQTTFVKCLIDPAQEVRLRAAKNLGSLTRMALRLDQLVSDLATAIAPADARVKDAYLVALEGALNESGDRFSKETLDKVGDAIRDAASAAGTDDDEVVLQAAAGALGAYAARCSLDEVQRVLEIGPLSAVNTGKPGERLRAVLIAASVAKRAAGRIEEAGVLGPFLQSVVKSSRDESVDIKQAAAKTVGRIVASEISQPSSSSLSSPSLQSLIPVFVALMGHDQHSEVHRQMLGVLRRIVEINPKVLEPYYIELVPSMLSIIRDSSGSLKLAAERTLARVLQLDRPESDAAQQYLGSGKAGSLAKQMLNETYVRRLGRLLPLPEEDDLADYMI